MAWYAEHTSCDYFGSQPQEVLLAVGWLERGHAFPRGPVPEPCFRRLCALLRDPWSPVLFRGAHHCTLCPRWLPRPGPVSGEGCRVAPRSWLNLFLPGSIGVYVAPEGIAHYIRTHRYRPPDPFLEAVLQCPAMGSPAYLEAIRAAGGGLVRALP